MLLAACGDSAGNPRETRVCGGAVHDTSDRSIVLRGVNLAGAHKNAPYTRSCFGSRGLHAPRADWGMTAIRFLITWSAVEPVQGQYDDAYLDWVAEKMQWASDAGLHVILDMHQDVYGEGYGFDGAPAWTCDASNYDGFVAKPAVWHQLRRSEGDGVLRSPVDGYADAAGAGRGACATLAERLADSPAIIGFDPIDQPELGLYAVATFQRTGYSRSTSW